MEDLKKLEEVVRRIAREEITRAFTAAEQVADGADMPYETGEIESTALKAISKVMERVARDVLADKHPVLDTEHASTPDVHTITAVPERSRPVCTGCEHPVHETGKCAQAVPHPTWLGHNTACTCPRNMDGKSTSVCTGCEHPVHETGKCAQPVLEMRRGGSSMTCRCTRNMGASTSACTWCGHTAHGGHIGHKCACGCTGPKPEHTSTNNPGCGHTPCDGWAICRSTDRPADEPRTGSQVVCTVCEHAPHGAGNCGEIVNRYSPFASPCECGGRAQPVACPGCEHAPHAAYLCSATIRKADGWTASCECGGRS